MAWQRKQRLRAIEIITFWHGRLNTGDIVAAFGISRIQASKDIKKYISTFPENIYYSLSDRAYLKAKSFKLHLTEGSVDEYIDHVSRMTTQPNIPIEKLAPHHTRLKANVVSSLLDGIRNKKGLSILYASMSRPEGTERIIYPHSIVDTGFRWHVRAYCENRKDFRDFNIGRLLNSPKVVDQTPKHALASKDNLWQKMVNIKLYANPLLSDRQKLVIESEFDMERGNLVVSTRACLIHYMLQRYQIDSDRIDNPPINQLLAVENPDSISPYLFGAS